MSLKKIFSVYLSALTSAIGWRQFIYSLPTDEAARCYSPPEHLPDTPAPWPRFLSLWRPCCCRYVYRRRHDHPAIQQSLGGSPAALSWLTNGFMLTFGSFCWPQGDGGCIDRKRIFIAGAALFCLSSLLFCLTHNLFLSGVLRALQGLAAAMILASGSAALAQLYDAPSGQAFSILGTVFGIGLAFGPLLIGFMIDAVVGAAYTPCLRCSRQGFCL